MRRWKKYPERMVSASCGIWNTETGEITEYRAAEGDPFGVFVFEGLAECDAEGYVVTDRNQKTTCEGLYAAGDVCIKPLFRRSWNC